MSDANYLEFSEQPDSLEIRRAMVDLKVRERLARLYNTVKSPAAKELVLNIHREISDDDSEMNQWLQDRLSRVDISPETLGQIEKAETTLGSDDVLGPDAIIVMELVLAKIGKKHVEFGLSIAEINYSAGDFDFAKKHREMLVLRPMEMSVDGEKKPVTAASLRQLLTVDPYNQELPIFCEEVPSTFKDIVGDKRPSKKWSGDCPEAPWGLVNKDFLRGSSNRNMYGQVEVSLSEFNQNLKNASKKARLRTATEVVWDTLLIYVTTGKKVLENKLVWTKDMQPKTMRYKWGEPRGEEDAYIYVDDFKGLDTGRAFPDEDFRNTGIIYTR